VNVFVCVCVYIYLHSPGGNKQAYNPAKIWTWSPQVSLQIAIQSCSVKPSWPITALAWRDRVKPRGR